MQRKPHSSLAILKDLNSKTNQAILAELNQSKSLLEKVQQQTVSQNFVEIEDQIDLRSLMGRINNILGKSRIHVQLPQETADKLARLRTMIQASEFEPESPAELTTKQNTVDNKPNEYNHPAPLSPCLLEQEDKELQRSLFGKIK